MSWRRDFLLPDLGEGLTEAEILRWLVEVGDTVTVDQPVAEVETAKAAVELPTPHAGRVVALHGAPGDVIAVGRPLVSVAAEEDTPVAGATGPRAEPDTVPGGTVDTARTDAGPDDTAAPPEPVLVGYGAVRPPVAPPPPHSRRSAHHETTAPPPPHSQPSTHHETTTRTTASGGTPPPAHTAANASPVPEEPGGSAPTASRAHPAVPPPRATDTAAPRTPVVSPVVRRMAREHGLDVARVAGSGPGGLVTRRDVTAAIAARADHRHAAPPVPATTGAAPAETAVTPATGAGAVERVPLRGARRTMAEQLTRSRREIPEATVWVDADATELLETRRAVNAAEPERPVGLLAMVAMFCLLGLRQYPALNATVDAERGEIVRFGHVHLGFAAQTPRGLMVPVVRDADRLSLRELTAALSELTTAARAGTLTPEQLTGGTFTVNNYGVFGVDGSAAIIPYPQAAILGLGRIVPRPWVLDSGGEPRLAVRHVTELTLSFDHRVCDGEEAAGFLRFVADRVERPHTLLGEVSAARR